MGSWPNIHQKITKLSRSKIVPQEWWWFKVVILPSGTRFIPNFRLMLELLTYGGGGWGLQHEAFPFCKQHNVSSRLCSGLGQYDRVPAPES